MRKIVTAVTLLAIVSCSKTPNNSSEPIVKNYRGLNGARSQATIEHANEANEILELVSENGKKIQLDLKSNSGNLKIYERNGISAEMKTDSLIIKQDGNVIPLSEIK